MALWTRLVWTAQYVMASARGECNTTMSKPNIWKLGNMPIPSMGLH
jgi:hypothetical protein